MEPLYSNIVKISLRKEILNTFRAASRIYYRVNKSPLHEHRDVCPAMRITIRFRFPLGLLARKCPYKESRLPAQERIGNVVYDIPDVGRIGLVQSDCDYVPACS